MKLIVTARLDPQSLATLLSFFKTSNLPITTRSMLIREAIETLVILLERSGIAKPFETDMQALDYLIKHGLGAAVGGAKRNRRGHLVALAKEFDEMELKELLSEDKDDRTVEARLKELGDHDK